MPKISEIEFIFLRNYSPPDVTTLDYDLDEFFAQAKSCMRHPKVIVELVPVNMARTKSSFCIEALFYLLKGDQVYTTSKVIQTTTIKDGFEKLSEILKDELGKKK